MIARKIWVIALTLSLGACASVPPPPRCVDNGTGLQPINPEMLTQEQLDAHKATGPDTTPRRAKRGQPIEGSQI